MMRGVSLIQTTVALVVALALLAVSASPCPSEVRLISSNNTVIAADNSEYLAQISAAARENDTLVS